jgi:hypothetical protein
LQRPKFIVRHCFCRVPDAIFRNEFAHNILAAERRLS